MIDIKKLVCHLEKDVHDLISRLNDIQDTINNTDPLIERVRLKILWTYEKDTNIIRIQKHVLCLQSLIWEVDSLESCKSCPLNWRIREVFPTKEQLVETLNKQLLEVTLSVLASGFVCESSFSEKGSHRYSFSDDA